MEWLRKAGRAATDLFVVWVIGAAALAFFWPGGFRWFRRFIDVGLGLVMFGMGLTLTPDDFRRVAAAPFAVAVGVLAQFSIMPLAAVVTAAWLSLPAPLAAGLILVGCCPGGTASNVITFLARGDVALSVTLTCVSTVCSVVATPYLTKMLAGRYLPVDAAALLRTILAVVILPVAGGLIARHRSGPRLAAVSEVLPLVSVVFIAEIVGCVVALARDRIAEAGGTALLAVVLHNGFGLALGYACAKLAHLDGRRCRTIAIEVGMQNSGLGAMLAVTHFGGDPLVALPSALFSVWHNVSGPAVASYWARRPPE